ncbi:hypothetical protein [Lysinibacillus endophyticus]|uniref:hypothetical protein n=1 Tax=Ureibacillus endophyticus TaxID=1978490 RepID=UPI003134C1C2
MHSVSVKITERIRFKIFAPAAMLSVQKKIRLFWIKLVLLKGTVLINHFCTCRYTFGAEKNASVTEKNTEKVKFKIFAPATNVIGAEKDTSLPVETYLF